MLLLLPTVKFSGSFLAKLIQFACHTSTVEVELFHVRAVGYLLKSELVIAWASAGACRETSAGSFWRYLYLAMGYSKSPDDRLGFGLGKLPDV